ncbi:hypothetical protein AMTRI_Chr06g171700 [Amborella trichopoda]
MITTSNKSIPCCGPPAAAPFSHPRLSLFLHPVPKICNQASPPFLPSYLQPSPHCNQALISPPAVGPQLCCPSLNLCHHFLSFANQNAELHLTKSIHQTLKFENQKKALADSTMAPAVSATKFFY